MNYVVEVQHSSDHDKDDVWHPLDIVPTEGDAIDAMLWFNGWRSCKGGGYRQSDMGYAGRPLRYRAVS